MKVKVQEDRKVYCINTAGTQNENDATELEIVVPEQYQDFNKKIVFITDDGVVWDIIENNTYKITNAITKHKSIKFYIWLTKDNQDFRSEEKMLIFNNNTNASKEITEEEIGGVNKVINLLESEITKVTDLENAVTKLITDIQNKLDNGEFNGKDATINGRNAIEIEAGNNIDIEETENGIKLNATGSGTGGGAVNSVNGQTGDVMLNAEDVGALPNTTKIPTKTSDLQNDSEFIDKTYHDNAKVDKEEGKGLSANDYTDKDKTKLDNLHNYDDTAINQRITNAEDDIDDLETTVAGHTTAIGNKADKTEIPTKISDLTNDSNFVSDGNYVHTDVNFTAEKDTKLAGLNNYDDTQIVQEISKKADKVLVVESTTTTQEIQPNKFYKFGEVTELNLTLAEITDTTQLNEYMFEFVSGTTATTLTLPDTIKWLEIPSIETNKRYQCSIVNNIGILVGVTNV